MEAVEVKSKPKKTRRSKKKPLSPQPTFHEKTKQLAELVKACHRGNVEIVRQILKVNLTLEINQQITSKEIQEKKLLHVATCSGNIEIVRELLKCNLEIDYRCGKSTALHFAAKNGNSKIVAELLSHGANVNLYDGCNGEEKCGDFCESPLLMASSRGHSEVVKELLKSSDVRIDVRNHQSNNTSLQQASLFSEYFDIVVQLLAHGANGNLHFENDDDDPDINLLHYASRFGRSDLVKELLKYNVSIDVLNKDGETALHTASEKGNAEIVAQLLANGANVRLYAEHDNKKNEKALHIASRYGHIEVLKEVLKYDTDIDDKNRDGETALHIAAENGHKQIVKALLDHGAKIALNVGDSPEGCNGAICEDPCYPEGDALYLATIKNNFQIVKMLLKYGAPLDNPCSPDVLEKACQLGQIEIVKVLIENGTIINAPNIQGEVQYWKRKQSLHTAVSYGHIDIVKELLKKGANVNHEDDYYGTPINVAAHDGNLLLVKELLNHGANPFHNLNGEEDDDYHQAESPIHAAASKGYQTIYEEMLLHGENDSYYDDDCRTSLHHAAIMGNSKAVKQLLARGCNPNAKDIEDQTPLHLAIEGAACHNAYDMIVELLNHGANVNIQAEEEDTPFHKAVKNHHLGNDNKIVHILLEERYNFNFGLRNFEGDSVLDIAIEEKLHDVVKMIAKRMCPEPRITDSIYPLIKML